jgi:hypothetical protein
LLTGDSGLNHSHFLRESNKKSAKVHVPPNYITLRYAHWQSASWLVSQTITVGFCVDAKIGNSSHHQGASEKHVLLLVYNIHRCIDIYIDDFYVYLIRSTI